MIHIRVCLPCFVHALICTFLFFPAHALGDEEVFQVPDGLKYKYNALQTTHFGKHTDTLRGHLKPHFYSNKIFVQWQYRPDTGYPWKSQSQTFTTSFKILDIWAVSSERLFVAGVSDDGKTIIERWNFTHFPITFSQPLGGGNPEWGRSLPYARRKELHRDDSEHDLDLVCDLYGDPQGRFILLMTWNSRSIFKMNPDNGDYIYLFGPSECPEMVNFRHIYGGDHPTEGYIYILDRYAPWDEFAEREIIEEGDTIYFVTDHIIFKDGDKDGYIDPDSLEYLPVPAWVARGYHR